MWLKQVFFALLLSASSVANTQTLETNGALLLKVEIVLGNQNQWLKVGVASFGTLNYNDISVESGLSFFAYQFIKRHTKSVSGLAFRYELYGLAGIGDNKNLLGSALSLNNNTLLFDANEDGGFNGIGFGISKDVLPKPLSSYGGQRGALLLRFSNSDYSAYVQFANDFRFGAIRGAGTDYGETGTLRFGFSKILNNREAYTAGLGASLFTPQADYGRLPRNPKNSDDGRKRVWFTLPPYKDLFYANFYAFGTYQNENYAGYTQLGINSIRTGTFIQNTLHDGFGLNPRYPWPVQDKDKLYVELGGSFFYNSKTNE